MTPRELNYGGNKNFIKIWAKEQICTWIILGRLCKDVFERRTSTGSKPFSLSTCLDATDLYCLVFFTLTETICPNIWSKSQLTIAKSSLPAVDVHHSKTIWHISLKSTSRLRRETQRFMKDLSTQLDDEFSFLFFDHGYCPQHPSPGGFVHL